jgi:hypothetical protein
VSSSAIVLASAADPTREHALSKRPPHQDAHTVLLCDRKDFTLDAAVEDRVWRLLGNEPLEAASLGDPVRFHEVRCRHRRGSECADLAAAHEVVSAESVSSISVSGSGRWI